MQFVLRRVRNVFLLVAVMALCRPVLSGQVITTYAGNGTPGFGGDGGPATLAKLGSASGVFITPAGTLFIADQNENRIRKVSAAGIITTVAGNGVAGYSADGVPATSSELNYPEGVAADRWGNIYIADQYNNRIRKVDTNGIIHTIAGNGSTGYTGDNGPATDAKLWSPVDVGVDGGGNVFFVDQDNSALRKISTAGIITTVAGNGTAGFGGDGGPASAALLNFPQGVAVDSAGNVFIADFYNSRVRKVGLNDTITTVAGNGTGGFGGDGGPATAAEIYDASSVAVDSAGNIYISDYYNVKVRKVNTSGIISTIAGNGVVGYNGDCIAATAANIYYPQGVTADRHGNVFIADFSDRVRKVSNTLCPGTTGVPEHQERAYSVFPDPSDGHFTLFTQKNGAEKNVEIFDGAGRLVYTVKTNDDEIRIDLGFARPGVYYLQTIEAGGIYHSQLIIY